MRKRSRNEDSIQEFEDFALHEVINRPADGGITALHMAALNGHVESLQLLLDLGASVTKVTVEDGTTIDLIGRFACTSTNFAGTKAWKDGEIAGKKKDNADLEINNNYALVQTSWGRPYEFLADHVSPFKAELEIAITKSLVFYRNGKA
ncbi:hypothetical protein K7X08_022339 [Anisodus acutangulus]|uniref:Uncharacterized protein n=1 Tax=Anisodus acutangulus TaxID=402998 RepID=A0A9Q1MIV4_9SOLA|nr:hypothetical protein K7X08_022339 [Anisodus acutangulus]